jgi:hypothetical protein
MPDAIVAPAEESKETKPAETVAAPKEETVGETLQVKEEVKEAKMVPEAVLIEYKKESKAVRKELDALKKSIEEGSTKKEVKQSLKDIATKHNVDAEFLNEFSEAVRKEAETEAEEKMKPIQEKENAEKRDKIFESHFTKTLEEMPEFKNLVNKDVIRTLAFDPKNANKTFAQILQDSYGHLVTGKKTLETTKARGGAQDTEVDFSKARTNTEYFKEVMADPELKRKYNDDMAKRNKF